MKFIVDAQLPRQLAALLRELDFDAIHTLDLLRGNRTPDSLINDLSVAEKRIVITKDSDFVDSFILRKVPWKLLLVSTGNISNKNLMALFLANIERLSESFDVFDFIEINRESVIFHS